MARSQRFVAQLLPGIHLTVASWLPAPDPSRGWPGWLRVGPREFVVHPLASEALQKTLCELFGEGARVHSPEQTEAISARAAAERVHGASRPFQPAKKTTGV